MSRNKNNKVLVIGSGGREHAIVWKLVQSPGVQEVFCAPGNAGISRHATCVPIKSSDIDGLLDFAKREGIDLTVVGPEAPLACGIVDRFKAEGLSIFGPSRLAAEIEASKVFAKDMLRRFGIPTGAYKVFSEPGEAVRFIEREMGVPVVLKADGLAAGKGVVIAKTIDEAKDAVSLILEEKAFGEAGARLLVEEFLDGEEASFMVVTDGKTVIPLATSQDHKAVFDRDQGPNTGGMGAYSPAPVIDERLFNRIMDRIMLPTVKAMESLGRLFMGVLYAGLMIKDGDAKVLEFNCRFGDPEAQPILMRMKTDLFELLMAAVDGRLDEMRPEWDPRPAVTVVMASKGYPGRYETGKVIDGIEEAETLGDVKVFHAGTAVKDGRLVTSGGRVLGVTALGETIPKAVETVYEAVAKISWDGMHYRRDIGQKAFRHLKARARSARVAVVMGSKSDMEVMHKASEILEEFGVSCETMVLSAHRSPELAAGYAKGAAERGIEVIIAGAGMAAHLAGAMAAHTVLPVIGVPLDGSPLNGLDSLLSTVQMPPGIPVATVSIGKAGAKNAAYLALQILALKDHGLRAALEAFRKRQADEIKGLNREAY
ncbi:MAG: phosphoribosylamine--glycine ligase [Dissulfurimicrobium sp.]|uniref:phosphoribosylamine--glycine ligase n=1 Tax=Dissulfurimicrobium TaxID=1769732 RepID=UPI001EDB972A|nr:phosphoribosylamine--glycine ligase [Dissulfurimicrobium hydrothermale]UKL13108.1 phosphoribosylamine--glycine ligase [Dissulfurimicrobium hydrothermale]